jgi:hypothetical protein
MATGNLFNQAPEVIIRGMEGYARHGHAHAFCYRREVRTISSAAEALRASSSKVS